MILMRIVVPVGQNEIWFDPLLQRLKPLLIAFPFSGNNPSENDSTSICERAAPTRKSSADFLGFDSPFGSAA